jgi:hypothetical protein
MNVEFWWKPQKKDHYKNIGVVGDKVAKCLESHAPEIALPGQYGTSLVTGLLRHISAVRHRLQKQNFWEEVFSLRFFPICLSCRSLDLVELQ